MAEEEVNYASVVFKHKNKKQPQAEQEETVYSEVKLRNQTSRQSAKTKAEEEEEPVYSKVQNKTSKQSANTNGEQQDPVYSQAKAQSQTSDTNASLIPEKDGQSKRHPHLLAAFFLAIVCVILISGIIGVCIFFLPKNCELKQNQTALTEDNNRLSSENQNLTQNLNDLTVRFKNLTEAYNLSDLRVTNLTTENQNLKAEKQELKTKNQNLTAEKQELIVKNEELNTKNQNLTTDNEGLKTANQQLETQSNNLKQQAQDKETELIQSNVSRAEWSINNYCPKRNNRRQCRPCLEGWIHEKSSCYAFNNAKPADRSNWTRAQLDCRGKGSDLAVITDQSEKEYITKNDFGDRFWIGLRVVGGKWKWVDGSDLNEVLWTETPDEGHCAVSIKNHGWTSVSCSQRNQWICELAALSVD